MTFVQRDEAGKINGLYAFLCPGVAEEELPDDDAEVLAFLNPPPSMTDYENAVQGVIDATAREKQFRDGVTLASYEASTVQPWASQAIAFIAWRDDVWQYAYSELSKVQDGEREQPSIEAFLLEIPEMVWP
ncbi:hypothetical protein IB244_21135 [Rhizobium sp. RHZ02]|uniref:hypothetical protein n=1 Tax=Rhizobium sp. RHZ02 TaxID=2769306 RepID=UPI0017830BC5|nr:hypothetical protein [Rhizobium sp. RHZ02]MBD9454018.1 hypothetical protein [Rhizobium sp. RHZ02]